jgi:hypothetical protein
MNLDSLDSSSRHFVDRLLTAHPDWRAFARIESRPGGGSDDLVVEVPPPDGADLARPLLVYTEAEGEVTVGFDYYHAHFDWPVESGPVREAFGADPLAFIVVGVLARRARGGPPARRGVPPDDPHPRPVLARHPRPRHRPR